MGRGAGESPNPSIQGFSSLPQSTYPHLAPTALFRDLSIRTGSHSSTCIPVPLPSHTNTFIQESPFFFLPVFPPQA